MQLGYYWARQTQTGWRVVEVVKGLHGAVLDGGFAARVSEYSEFVGPLTPPPAEGCRPAWIIPSTVKLHIYEDD